MQKSMCAVLVIAGVSHGASGAWGMKYEVWNGASWVTSLDAAPGDVVAFRIGAYFSAENPPAIATPDGTGPARALARFTGSNQAIGFVGGDMFQNVVRTIPGGSEVIAQISGATIGTSGVQSFGSQLFIGDIPFLPYTEILVGEVKVGSDSAPRLITILNKTFGSGNAKGLTFYTDASLVNKFSAAPVADDRVDINATINVIPAPVSLALIGLGGLVAARRRRS